jgi:hypothetical protein
VRATFAAGLVSVPYLICGCLIPGPAHRSEEVQKCLIVEESEKPQKELLVNFDKCETDFLRKYSRTKSASVRILVSQNPGVDEQILDELSKDADEDVRGGVAISQYTPHRLLVELLRDRSEHVRFCLARNGKLTHDEIRELLFSFERPPLLEFAENPNLPDDIRKYILSSTDMSAKDSLRHSQ